MAVPGPKQSQVKNSFSLCDEFSRPWRLSKFANSRVFVSSAYNPVVRAIEQLHIPPEGRKSLFLATLDVRALYHSIPHDVGIAMELQQAIPTD